MKKICLGMVSSLALLTPSLLTASTLAWSGTSSDSWSDGTNWSGGIPPANGDELVFPSLLPSGQFTAFDDIPGLSINSLTINFGANYQINGGGGTILSFGPTNPFIDVSFGNQIFQGFQVSIPNNGLTLNLTNTTTEIQNIIQGTGAITKLGGGLLILSGASTYSGGTNLNGGTTEITSNTNLGASSESISFGGGTLSILNDISMARSLIANGAPVIISVANFSTLAYNGSVSNFIQGNDGLTLTGPGTFSMQGSSFSNTYTGNTQLNNGILQANLDSQLGDVNLSSLVLDGGQFHPTASFTMQRGIVLNNPPAFATGLINIAPGITLTHDNSSHVISGSTFFSILGGGTLILTGSGSNTYTNDIFIQLSTLKISGDNNLGNPATSGIQLSLGTLEVLNSMTTSREITTSGIVNTIVVGTGLTLTHDNALHTIFIGGVMVKDGAGTFTLTGPQTNIFGLGISILNGTVQGDTNTLQNSITNNGTLNFNQNIVGTYLSPISGAGPLNMIGSGTLNLSAINTYTGQTTIASGTLGVTGPVGNLSSSSILNIPSASGIFNLTGSTAMASITIGGLSGVTGSQVILGSNGLIVWPDPASLSTTFAGTISGPGLLSKMGDGTLVLTGTNNYAGGTIVNSGGPLIGTTNSLQGNISILSLAANSVVFSQNFDGTYAGIMSGFGGFTSNVIGTLTLTGANTYMGGTIVNSGILQGDTTSLQGSISTAVGTTVKFNQATNNTYAGPLSGGGSLTKSGSGTLILAGANSYTGGTLISNGVLQGDTTSLQGNITNNASLNFNQTSNGTYAGTVSGSGVLIKTGNGVLILTGPQSYMGGTTVMQGALQGNTTSLQGTILNNAEVIFDQNTTGTYAGSITGAGTLTKQGSGELILSGINSYTNPTTVLSGALAINGSITSDTTIAPGARLQGSGTIQGNVSNNGTIGPGNSIGVITINGNVTFNNGSIFEVELDPTHADKLIDATGTVTILPGSTLAAIPTPASYGQETTYQVITAGGGVAGTFDFVTNTYPLIFPQVIYGATEVDIILRYANFSTTITQGNPGKVAKSLNGVTPAPGTDLFFVFQQLYLLNTAELESALNQMQPSLSIGLSLAQQNNFNLVTSALRKRTDALHEACGFRSQESQLGRKNNRWDIWTDVSLGFYHQRDQNQNVGFHSDSIVGAAGVDYVFSNNVYLGVMGAYTYSDVEWHRSQADGNINSYYGGIYSSWLNNFCFVNISAIGAFNNYGNSRKIKFGLIDRHAQSRHNGASIESHLDFGFMVPSKRGYTFSPYAQFDHIYLHQTSYHEHGAKSLNLHINDYNANMLRTDLGLQGQYCISVGRSFIIPSMKIGWVRETRFNGKHLRSRLSTVPNSFSVEGIYPDRSLAAPGAALTGIFLNNRLNVSLTYEGEFGRKISYNAGNFSLIWAF